MSNSSADGCSNICRAVPECFKTEEDCEFRRLMLEYTYLLDDLAYCIEHPDKDPCSGRRRSKRTREEAVEEACVVRDHLQDILQDLGGKKPK